ncbi:uncharacterized protein LOC126745347 [Anthonomus grandis grandis]|uniref:uncharacterized protein LOC126745347 n=1 Tax=Anthonomus grandis grandis TaxID=2921223 RepID=UPI002166165B|nr:uncharacterized protein LOC126745347 [Anthonomus grandis grandis]
MNKSLYEALRSNDPETISKLLETASLSAISSVYNQVQLRNVPLLPEVQLLVESHLINRQFMQKKSSLLVNQHSNFEIVKNHLEFLCELIKKFLETHKVVSEMQVLYHLRHIAQHMTVVKRELDFSYKLLPWEEIQFYICLYLFNEQNHESTDAIFKFFINKATVCKYLNLFWHELCKLKSEFTEKDLEAKKVVLSRIAMRESILAKCVQFKDLLDDFLLVRDIYSLNKITRYINKALEVDVNEHGTVAYLVIERALQVAGEYLKNTADSPNLSEHLYKYLLRCSPRNLKNILVNVRNMLSHSFSLNRKINIEESEFFIKIQHDLKKIKNDILYVLYVQKIGILRTFLTRLLKFEHFERLGSIETLNSVHEVEGFDASDFQRTKELITVFCEQVLEDSDEDADMINEIFDSLKKYEHKNVSISTTYLTTIKEISDLFNAHQDFKTIRRIIRTHLSMLSTQEPHNLYQEVFLKIRQVADNFKKRRNYDPDDFKSPDDKSININGILNEIYNYIRWRLPKIKWMEVMESTLVFKEEKEEKLVQVEHILRLVQEKTLNQDIELAIVKSKEVHEAKSSLMAYEGLNVVQFKENLEKLNLPPKRQEEILQQHAKNKRDKILTAIKKVNDSYGTLLKNLPDMFPTQKYTQVIIEFFKGLQLKKTLLSKATEAVQLVIEDQVKQCYNARLNALEILLINQPNELDMIALEMLILDLLEVLENLKLLHDNRTLLAEEPVILMGKQMRNITTHGDLLMDILPGNIVHSMMCHGKKLLEIGLNILELTDVTIGLKIHNPGFNYKEHFDKSIAVVANQAKLFEAAESGDTEAFNEALRQGADPLGLDFKKRRIRDVANICQSQTMLREKNTSEVLFDCIRLGLLDTVKYFFNYKSELFNDHLTEALELATKYGHLHIISYLLQIFHNRIDTELLLRTASVYGQCEIVRALSSNENLKDLMHLAAKHGHDDLITFFLINKNIDPNLTDNEMRTPLHWASYNNHTNVGEVLLLSKKCNVNLQDNQGMTSLHLAIRNGCLDMFDKLINLGQADLGVKTFKGDTVLHLAAQNGSCELIEALVQRYNIDVDILNANEETPLILAAFNGHHEAVECLLKNGAEPNHQNRSKNEIQDSAMSLAAAQGNIEIVQRLINHKANIDIEDQKGWRPLHVVAQNGYVDLLDLFLTHKVDIHAKYKPGATALHAAVRNEHEDIVKKLIDKGADATAFVLDLNVLRVAALVGNEQIASILLAKGVQIDDMGSDLVTPLHAATWKGHKRLVELFLREKAKVNAQTIEKWSAIHFAAKFGFHEIARVLLANGSDPLVTIDTGCNAFHIACGEGHVEVMQLLLQYNVDVNVRCSVKNSTGLHWACANSRLAVVELLLLNNADVNIVTTENSTMLHELCAQKHYNSYSVPIAKALISQGVPINAKDIKGATPLHLASINGNLALVQKLLDNDADINEETETRSALNLAVAMGHAEVVQLLLEHGAQVNNFTIYKRTCLHIAAEKRCKDIVQHLLRYNANVNVADGNLMTPLHWAVQTGAEDVVKLLLDAANARDIRFRLPLDIAFEHNHESIALTLIQVTTIRNSENHYLRMACQKGMNEVVEMLLQQHACDVNESDVATKNNPLLEALLNGHSPIADILLKNGASVNVSTPQGLTPLHLAAAQGFAQTTLDLIKLKASVDALTCQQETPLYYASLQGFDNIVDTLVSHGADVHIATSPDGFTALSVAAEKGHLQIIKNLIQHGADVNITNAEMFSPLHIATLFNHVDCVGFLLNNGANIRGITRKEYSALHIAALNGCLEIVQLVLSRIEGDDELIYYLNEDGDTALDLALKGEHSEVVSILIEVITRNVENGLELD